MTKFGYLDYVLILIWTTKTTLEFSSDLKSSKSGNNLKEHSNNETATSNSHFDQIQKTLE